MLVCPICERLYPPHSYERCPEDDSLLYAMGDGVDAGPQIGPGSVVAGKYEILEEMERRGGAGRTFCARQTRLDRVVELRVLPRNTITRPADHARFSREVETWGRLRDDHLVRLYDSGFTDENAPYMALELVDGSVGQRLRGEGPLPIETVRTIADHVLQALAAAHDANVLHRDISPDALVLGQRPDGRAYARLTGFGLAKHLGDEEDDPTAITMTGHVVGNPRYMAPETIMLGVLDQRTDLYALGVTLYELLAGQRPFIGDSLADMLKAHVQGTPRPLRGLRPDAPADLQRLVARLVEREPERRFQSAAEARTALSSDAAGGPPGFVEVLVSGLSRTGWWTRILLMLVMMAFGALLFLWFR